MIRRSYMMLGIFCLVGSLLLGGCAQVRIMRADINMLHEDYHDAIPLYKEHLDKHSEAFRVRSRLGFAYLKTGQMDQAIAELEKVLEAVPGDPYSVLYLGMAYLNKEAIDKAVSVWQGYRNERQPKVEAEINRLLTMLQIADSQRKAKDALAREEELMAVKPDVSTIAVCNYHDLSPDKSLRAFQKGLAAMVITDLSKVKSVKVVERLRMQALLEEMKLGETGLVDESTAPKVGRLLGAESLITGNLTLGSIQATTTLTSATKGRVKASITVSVEKEKFYELSARIVQGMAEAMNIELSPGETRALGVPQTTNYQAFIYFGQALDALDAGNWEKAKDLFAKAAKEDPKFDMARNGRDACPEIDLDIGDLGNMTGAQLLDQAENSLGDASTEQKALDELIDPENGESEVPDESDDFPEVKLDMKPENPVDNLTQEALSFPDPPKDEN